MGLQLSSIYEEVSQNCDNNFKFWIMIKNHTRIIDEKTIKIFFKKNKR